MLFRSLLQLKAPTEIDPKKLLDDISRLSHPGVSKDEIDTFVQTLNDLSAEAIMKALHSDDVDLVLQAKIIYECFGVPSTDYYKRLYNVLTSKNRFFGENVKNKMIQRWICLIATEYTPTAQYNEQHHLAIAKKFYEWKFNSEAIAHVITAMKLSNGQLKPFSSRASHQVTLAKDDLLYNLKNMPGKLFLQDPAERYKYLVDAVNFLYENPADYQVYEQFVLTLLKRTQSELLDNFASINRVLFDIRDFTIISDGVVLKDIINPFSCFQYLEAGDTPITDLFINKLYDWTASSKYRVLFNHLLGRTPRQPEDALSYASFMMENLEDLQTKNLDIVIRLIPYFYAGFMLCQRERFTTDEAYAAMRSAFMNHPFSVLVRSMNMKDLLAKIRRKSYTVQAIDLMATPLIAQDSPLLVPVEEDYIHDIDELKLNASANFFKAKDNGESHLQTEMRSVGKSKGVRR